jgi:hypothetical protein
MDGVEFLEAISLGAADQLTGTHGAPRQEQLFAGVGTVGAQGTTRQFEICAILYEILDHV